MNYWPMSGEGIDGFDESFAQVIAIAQTSLMESTMKLVRYNQGHPINDEGDVIILIFGIISDYLDFDPTMMQEWNKMLAALSSTPTRDDVHINLSLVRVSLEPGDTAFVLLLDAFKTLHRPRLFVTSNDGGTEFAIAALKTNSTLHAMTIDGTAAEPPFKSEKCALNLVEVVVDHPSLNIIDIQNCGIDDITVTSAFIPVLRHIKHVRLDVNRIVGSHGATLITDCLATNPFVKGLSLAHNALTDSDALKLAMSLKTNTTLRSLELIGNDFTAVGYQSLFDAVRGSGTLNSIHDANHVLFH